MGALYSAVAWGLLGPGREVFPWPYIAIDVVTRSTPDRVAAFVEVDWLLERLGDDVRYVAFGVTNVALSAIGGALGGLLASRLRKRTDARKP